MEERIKKNVMAFAIVALFLILVPPFIHSVPLVQSKSIAKLDLTVSPTDPRFEAIKEAKVTASHSTFTKIETEEDIRSIMSGKVDVRAIASNEVFSPLPGVNISVYFIDLSGDTPKHMPICVGKTTDASGTITCPIDIATFACGKVVAEFEGTDTDSPAISNQYDYCVSRVPFVFLIDNTMIMIFIFFGILAAGLYAAGRNPLAAFDITTPRVKGATSYPTYLYSKIKKLPGLRVASGAMASSRLQQRQMALMTGLFGAGLMSRTELKGAQAQMAGQSVGAKGAIASSLAFRKYYELVRRIEFTQKQIDQLSTQGIKTRQAKQKLSALQESKQRLEDVKSRIAEAFKESIGALSVPNFIELRANVKTAEALALINKESWKSGTWVEESKHLMRMRTSDPSEAALIPLMDARLHIEESRIRILSQAVAEVEAKGTESQRERIREVSERIKDIRNEEKDVISELLNVLRNVNAKLSDDLNGLYSRTVADSRELSTIEATLIHPTGEMEDARMKLKKAKSKDEAEAAKNEIQRITSEIQSILLRGYDKSIAIIGGEMAAARKVDLTPLESHWKGDKPPQSMVDFIPRFTSIAPSDTIGEYENQFTVLLSDKLRKFELVIEREGDAKTRKKEIDSLAKDIESSMSYPFEEVPEFGRGTQVSPKFKFMPKREKRRPSREIEPPEE